MIYSYIYHDIYFLKKEVKHPFSIGYNNVVRKFYDFYDTVNSLHSTIIEIRLEISNWTLIEALLEARLLLSVS